MKNKDMIEVAKTLIDRSNFMVFDDNTLSHIECCHCGNDVYKGHNNDCVVVKAKNIINKLKNKKERRSENREALTNKINNEKDFLSGEMAVRQIISQGKRYKYEG